MFTGIVEETGKIKSFAGSTLTVDAKKVLLDTKIGDSIAINGCCQTVVKLFENSFQVNVSQETFRVTNFNLLKSGDCVNLERALTLNSRLGGHIVQGHVDGIAEFVKNEQLDEFYNLYFKLPQNLLNYVVEKGSISINGISLTIAEIDNDIIKIAVIPHTFLNTNLKNLVFGDKVNIETDIVSKYVKKFLTSDKQKIDENFLLENGFM